MSTVPNIESDLPGAVVYIGRDRKVRITSTGGFEKLGPDGNWYSLDIQLLVGETGAIVPAVSVALSADN